MNNFDARPELAIAFKIVAKKCKILIELMRVFLCNKSLLSNPSNSVKLNSIFDEKTVILFYTFIFNNIFNELVNISEDEEFILELQNMEINDYDKDVFMKNCVSYILEFSTFMNNHYNLIANGNANCT